jgi:UDP-N-acetylmuramoylalanine-D-glutamate ligase
MRNASLRACFNRLEETRYKLEFVARVRGREYINDAASRSVNSTWYALESTRGGLIWIADAPKQAADYGRLVPAALRKVRMLLIVGGDSDSLRSSFTGIVPTIESCPNMAAALQKAYHYEADDVKVIYSPACDNGVSVTEEGEVFRHEVNEL